MRVAIVSPLPPAPTGIADFTMDVVAALQPAHSIELFHDQPVIATGLAAPAFRIDEIEARAAVAPFDAVVYQMGNAPAHDFMYDWMPRVSGAVVIHDLVLHAFTRRFLQSPEALAYAADPSSDEKRRAAQGPIEAYRQAVEAIHPGLGQKLVDAHLNTTGDLLSFAYPLFEPPLAHARAAAAHNAFMVDAIRAARPDLPCVTLAMPVTPLPVRAEAVAALRARLGLTATAKVVGCFGLMTREKRIESVMRAVARLVPFHPDLRLVLAGPVADPAWLDDLLDRTGVRARTVVTGRLEADDFAAAMALSDAVVNLRYPTARETSAALLRVMAQGRPVIIADIANQAEIPEDAVLRVDIADEEGGLSRAIDWLLRHEDAARAMGERAALHAREQHSPAKTLETWDQLLKSAAPVYSSRTS